MISGRNIVCVASSWYDPPTSKHHIMRILAERNRVVWVNFHASRRPRLRRSDFQAMARRLWRTSRGTQRVEPGMDVLSPLLIPLPEHRLVRRYNTHVLASRIRRALGRFADRPTQLWLFTPDVPELIDALPAERVVYYCVDDFAGFSGFSAPLIRALEARTVAASDVVIATSDELYAARGREHANVHFVPHGVDFDHFAAAVARDGPVPDDIGGLPRPVLGYFGLISDYMDFALLAAVARHRPAWSLVLIGPSDCDTRAVAGLPNVHLLGSRPYAQLPAYGRAFDVALIPFRMNRVVRAANPIKLREYLAAGLPVVSAPLPAVREYAGGVRVVATVDEFIGACEAALRENDERSRRVRQALVREESWRNRVEWLSRIVSGELDHTDVGCGGGDHVTAFAGRVGRNAIDHAAVHADLGAE